MKHEKPHPAYARSQNNKEPRNKSWGCQAAKRIPKPSAGEDLSCQQVTPVRTDSGRAVEAAATAPCPRTNATKTQEWAVDKPWAIVSEKNHCRNTKKYCPFRHIFSRTHKIVDKQTVLANNSPNEPTEHRNSDYDRLHQPLSRPRGKSITEYRTSRNIRCKTDPPKPGTINTN